METQRMAAPPDVDLVPVRRALISVSDKSDVAPFAQALATRGVEILSTGGTARTLAAAGINCVPIDSVTGFPEMMDGRVKTLHPLVHGALLARRDDPSHVQSMREHGIEPIDLVCVNLYPFEKTVSTEGISDSEAIEQIDIGGPAMVRSAAKNFRFVATVTSPGQYDRVVNELRQYEGATSLGLRRELAAAAFSRTAEYDTAISTWMTSRTAAPFPVILRLNRTLLGELRYGENPHQKAAVYFDPEAREPSVVRARVLSGKPLSYNNLNDAAAALDLVHELGVLFPDQAAAAIVKHANPCGAAAADEARQAFESAYEGDPLAAYGGILAINRPLDVATAQTIVDGQRFLEVIVAPGFDEESVQILSARWKNVRLLDIGSLSETIPAAMCYRSISGGMLVQQTDTQVAKVSDWRCVAGPEPDERLLRDAAFIWTVTKHLKSNAVAIGCGFQMLGAGMGQVDRVTACRLAVERAGSRLRGRSDAAPPIAASDAFFPFPDGPELLIEAGVRCIVHPGGSMRDEETIALCQARDVTCLLTGVRHFRH